MMVSFVLSFFPRDVLDEILNLIESVSEDFPSYSNECLENLVLIALISTVLRPLGKLLFITILSLMLVMPQRARKFPPSLMTVIASSLLNILGVIECK